MFGTDRQKLLYVYDFGDDWVHEIVLEDILTVIYPHPVCTAGKGCCPPENCGGPMGYEMLKETLETKPNSAEARRIRAELGLKRVSALKTTNLILT